MTDWKVALLEWRINHPDWARSPDRNGFRYEYTILDLVEGEDER